MSVTLVSVSKSSVSKQQIEKTLKLVFKELHQAKVKNRKKLDLDLTVAFVGPDEMKRINSQFRKKNKVTDVLSFESENELGEILLCPHEIRNRSRNHGLSYREELLYNLIHGVLHLLGYDHEKSERQAQQMFKIQDSIFEKLT